MTKLSPKALGYKKEIEAHNFHIFEYYELGFAYRIEKDPFDPDTLTVCYYVSVLHKNEEHDSERMYKCLYDKIVGEQEPFVFAISHIGKDIDKPIHEQTLNIHAYIRETVKAAVIMMLCMKGIPGLPYRPDLHACYPKALYTKEAKARSRKRVSK